MSQNGAKVQDRLRPEGDTPPPVIGALSDHLQLMRVWCPGLPGGAGAFAGVAAEECGNREQAIESQSGGAVSAEPAGEEGA